MVSGIFRDRDIGSFRSRLERAFIDPRQDLVPKKSREECLETVQRLLPRGKNTEWIRCALDLVTHTIFCTERRSNGQQLGDNRSTNLSRITDYEHWDKLVALLAEEHGAIMEELKLLLIVGSFVEVELLVSREIDVLIDPYRAVREIQARTRYDVANRPRGFDIESLKNLTSHYNDTGGTPIHELVECGLSNVINLHSNADIFSEYQRIFVKRLSVPCKAVQGMAIFALSYKHEGSDVRMSQDSFSEVCNALKAKGFGNVQLWIDAVLKRTIDTWSRRGLLPYTVLPIVIHNNEFYNRGKERIWLKLERTASSGRPGVLYTRPIEHDNVPWRDFVMGDSRDLVAGCILVKDYDPQSVTYKSDVTDLEEWATEHFTVATYRSFFGINKLGHGGVTKDMEEECLYSGALKYNETMSHRDVGYVAKDCASSLDSQADSGHREVESRALARNERLMTFMCRVHGRVFRVRVNCGLGISILRIGMRTRIFRNDEVQGAFKTSEIEKREVLQALTHALVHLAEKGECGVCGSINVSQGLGGQARIDTIRIDKWKRWCRVFPVVDTRLIQ